MGSEAEAAELGVEAVEGKGAGRAGGYTAYCLSLGGRKLCMTHFVCIFKGGMEGPLAVRASRTAERVLCCGMARAIRCTTLTVVIVLEIADDIDGKEMSDVARPASKAADRSPGTRVTLFPQQSRLIAMVDSWAWFRKELRGHRGRRERKDKSGPG